ncbi:MAG TPA: hypothetical protein VN512_02690 [Clostridia bacterium]|nr:hypothetical protein [Clostridia bacterium]
MKPVQQNRRVERYRIKKVKGKMVQKNGKGSGQYFVRVFLCSGASGNPLGSEELAIFCECSSQEPTVAEVKKGELIQWVNSNPKCKKNQSNENYRISKNVDAMTVVFLAEREIQACRLANRIFPCLVS